MSEARTTGAPSTAAGFIGRAAELAQLEAALKDAGEGSPQLVLVSGESGVGKSRLLAEFRERLPELGAGAFGGECIDLGEDELPYAPLVAAIRPLVRAADPILDELGESARAEFARLVPEMGGDRAELGEREVPAEAQRRLFDALLALLYRRSEAQPIVFWLEDVHWADRSTRSFVSFLARSLREEKVLCVLTLRSDELHRRHPMRPLMAELARLPNAGVLELARFNEPELRDQLRSILGADPDVELVDRMFKRSEGNPLFTEQLLAGGLDGRGGLPPTLRDALLLRLERLDETTQRVLRILAVVGSTDEGTLTAATGLGRDALRAAIREAVAANLLDAEEGGSFRFHHALLREVVYDDLLPGERADGHLEVAKALEAGVMGEPSAMRSASIAHHYNSAGAQDEAIRSAVMAAEAEIHVHADAEAASLLERVLALWPRVADPEELTGKDYPQMLYWTGLVSFCAGDDLRAVALYEKAAEAMRDEPDPRRRAEVLGRLASLQWTQGMADRALDTLDEALQLAPQDAHSLRALLLAHRVRIALLRGKFAHTIEFSGEALRELQLSGPDGPQEIRITVLNRLGTALVALGQVEKGEEALRDAVEAGSGNPDYNDELGTAYGNYSDAMALIGRSAEAEEIARQGIEAVADGTRPHRWLYMQLSDILFHLGRWGEAAQVLPPGPGAMTGGYRVCFDLYSGQLALGLGELDVARELFDDAQELIRDSIEPQFISMLAALRAELELAESNVPAARTVIDQALDRLEFCTEDELRFLITCAAGVAVEAQAAQLACDLGSAEDEAAARESAERMLARVEATRPETYDDEREPNPVSNALVLEARAEYGSASHADDLAERWQRAAEGWVAVERPMRSGQAHRRRAEALLEAGDRDGAARALADARVAIAPVGPSSLADELESFAARSRLGALTVPDSQAAPLERPFGLTEREMQVIALVAEGQTNREIAERLYMAEKTASVHVSRILAKLDVRSRTEAAAVAHRQGLTAVSLEPES